MEDRIRGTVDDKEYIPISMRYNPPSNRSNIERGRGNKFFCGLVKLIMKVGEGAHAPLKMIEIGAFAGESTSIFAMSGYFNSIEVIDPWGKIEEQGDTKASPLYYRDDAKVYEECIWPEIIEAYHINTRHWDYIKHYREYSQDCHEKFEDQSYDLVYIDGDHSREAVERDIELYLPKVKKGGWIGGHDFATWKGVTKAVNNKIGAPRHFFGDSSWLHPVK